MGCDTRSGRVLQGGAGAEEAIWPDGEVQKASGIAGPGAKSENKHCMDSSLGESCQVELPWIENSGDYMWQNLNINCGEVMRSQKK